MLESVNMWTLGPHTNHGLLNAAFLMARVSVMLIPIAVFHPSVEKYENPCFLVCLQYAFDFVTCKKE